MEALIKTIQFILALSVLIIAHELGHFYFAKLFKTRVEKFYLFFNPWFSLFKFKKGETTYGLGWLPLGGYVKISGMIDESMDKEQMKQPPQPHEFRSKPAHQRLLIMLGGVMFNVLLAILIYIFMLFLVGEKFLPAKNLKYGIVADSLAQKIGLQDGDKIIALNNKEVVDFFDITPEFIFGNVKNVTIVRNTQEMTFEVPTEFFGMMIESKGKNFISIRYPLIVDDFASESQAQIAGVEKGDVIKGIGTDTAFTFNEFRAAIMKFKNENTTLMINRNGNDTILNIFIPENQMIGVAFASIDKIFDFETRHYNFIQAIPAGVVKTYNTTVDYLGQLRLLFRPEVKATESIGGFITIGSIFSPTWDWLHFWTITAFLSIILAIMNLLPIPALDGGHVMFLIYEIIFRRKPGEKFMEYAQIAGMIILFSLLLFANLNDIIRHFFR
ncbi:MAG: RIP metalloprotease RseP [Bacteroidetes bacterium]|nr:RIP metalloprotease RseP [Bacteroidota bacterium]